MNAKWITPAVTAFDANGRVDIEANLRVYDHLIEGGMDGILILGSIGEFFAISMEEKRALIAAAAKHIDRRVTLYVGTCCMVLEDCISLSNEALACGADGVMVISPYYFNLPKSAILHFYGQVAKNVSGPVLLYNFPDRTGYDLTPEIVLQLARNHKNIVGIKDTTGAMGHTRAMITLLKKEFPEFLIFSGFDEFFGHNLLCGGDGCIAGISNFAPRLASGYAAAVKADSLTNMLYFQQRIDRLMAIYDIGEQFIPIIKEAMIQTGVPIGGYCAQPMLPATEQEKARISALLKEQGLI